MMLWVNSMISIITYFLIFISCILFGYTIFKKPYRDRIVLNNVDRIYKIIDQICIVYFTNYIHDRVQYDSLVKMKAMSPERYNTIVKECSEFIINNIPKQTLKLLFKYIGSDQLLSIILIYVDAELNKYYKQDSTIVDDVD